MFQGYRCVTEQIHFKSLLTYEVAVKKIRSGNWKTKNAVRVRKCVSLHEFLLLGVRGL